MPRLAEPSTCERCTPLAKADSVELPNGSLEGREVELHVAGATLNPAVAAGRTIERLALGALPEYLSGPGFTYPHAKEYPLALELTERMSDVHDGDLSRAESMLLASAYTLQALFHKLLRLSEAGIGSTIQPPSHLRQESESMRSERIMRLALSAQEKMRRTLETLAAVKNPTHATFVKQANIAQQQQVNNRGGARRKRRKSGSKKQPRLLERQR